MPAIRKGLCASVYTQISDVEDEINGLLTYDRKVEKVDPAKLLPIAAQLQKAPSPIVVRSGLKLTFWIDPQR